MAHTPSKGQKELLHGALDALILKTLARGPSHGYAIARFIEDATGEAVLVEDGSLYPALYRLERKRLGGSRMGHVRARPAGQALSHHRRRPRAAGRRDGDLEAVRRRRVEGSLRVMKRSLRSWIWRVPLDQEVDEELALASRAADARAGRTRHGSGGRSRAALGRMGDVAARQANVRRPRQKERS